MLSYCSWRESEEDRPREGKRLSRRRLRFGVLELRLPCGWPVASSIENAAFIPSSFILEGISIYSYRVSDYCTIRSSTMPSVVDFECLEMHVDHGTAKMARLHSNRAFLLANQTIISFLYLSLYWHSACGVFG
ncbi:hypothetical protein BDW59DRAFT_118951 [Aspergillus cavernicola]|uniref:Uncharacterized protein n=1 Tax=Aspergillus cavernicola TaxID=176166 RepID=A0ABR4HWM7_9EURO